MSRDDNKKKKKIGASAVGWVLWLLALIVLVVIFLINKNRIAANLKDTGFFSRVFGKTPAFLDDVESSEDYSNKNDVGPFGENVEIELVKKKRASSNETVDSDEEPEFLTDYRKNEAKSEESNSSTEIKTTEDVAEYVGSSTSYGTSEDVALGVYDEKASSMFSDTTTVSTPQSDKVMNPNLIYEPNTTDPVKSEKENPTEFVDLRLFFIELNEDGTRNIKEVSRKMKKTSTPLTDSINALIDGPTPAEEKSFKCRTMVSPGTRLLSASVNNGIATLNFTEDFEFNSYGIEGVMWELDQIVYTATAFPTVQKVQFLIEGTRREYLSEGLRIGEPIGRDSL